MFFKLLKLVGIDVTGKLAELKADFELQILQASEKVSHRARNIALVAGFFMCAAIMVLLAVIVCLIALYRWAVLHYGAFTGLALVAGVLVILAAIFAGIALAYANSRSSGVLTSGRVTAPQPALFAQSIPTRRDEATASSYQSSSAKAEDLLEPLHVLLGRYLRVPKTGKQTINNLLRKVGKQEKDTKNDAVAHAAQLVRSGDRATMLSVLGTAALLGWLAARGAEQAGPSAR
jgi:hypothetical protein